MENQSSNNTKQVVEISIRLAALIFLLYYCFQLLSPFLLPVLWAAILAVALYPVHVFLTKKLGGRKTLSSVIVTLTILCLIFIPAGLFLSSLTTNIISLKDQIEQGSIRLDLPSENIKTWPLIGNKLFDGLHNLSGSLTTVFEEHKDQVLAIAKVIMGGIIGTGLSFLQVILSIIIAGVLLATTGAEAAVESVFNRIVGKNGKEYLDLTASTIRSVLKGVLGVAVIQSALCAFGFFFSGIPHAGIWTLCALVLCIIQIGPGLVIFCVIGYLYATESSLYASAWTAYMVLVMLSDNILKPILLGKGAKVPMLVIFLGVIGGFLLEGFIGLFTGAIILSIGYKLFLLWVEDQKAVS
jgi:predicted PurR-regulated permease PerM